MSMIRSNNKASKQLVSWLLLVSISLSGCRTTHKLDTPPVTEMPMSRPIETANVDIPVADVAVSTGRPLTVNQVEDPEEWAISLQEVVQITLANSDVIRNIGGRVVSGAAGAPSVYDVALQEVGAGGVEAALSAFDAQVASSMTFNRDEQAFNNQFIGGGATSLASNSGDFNLQISKEAATGTQFFVRNVTNYNRNNGPFNLFRSVYNTRMEGEFRHPLLRGSGIDINRIAGPNGSAGNYNGVVLARIRTDIALANFEASVRDLMRDVETAYWNLYFAYRTLDARTAAYEASLASWRTVQDQLEAGTEDAEGEALARANYYQSTVAMQNALSGGTGTIGVYSAERDLRLLMGIPASDGRLIRPSDEPSVAKQVFDWEESLGLAFDRRVELRRQKWTIKQREKELVAAKHFLLSQLDLVGLYRYRGFGDDLLGRRDELNGSAFNDLWSGALQGWQLGLSFSTTLGKRREHAAVRAAELQLARERAVLRNQELTVSNNLSGQFAEMERAYIVARANFNRSIAERRRLNAAKAKYDAGEELLEFVLSAQQRTADADSQFYQTVVDYNLAVANMHYQRGTYLDYMGVRLSEGPWSPDSYRSYQKEFRRFKPRMSYCVMQPGAVSNGAYNQRPPQMVPAEGPIEGEMQMTPQMAPVEPSMAPVEPAEVPNQAPLYDNAAPLQVPAPEIDSLPQNLPSVESAPSLIQLDALQSEG